MIQLCSNFIGQETIHRISTTNDRYGWELFCCSLLHLPGQNLAIFVSLRIDFVRYPIRHQGTKSKKKHTWYTLSKCLPAPMGSALSILWVLLYFMWRDPYKIWHLLAKVSIFLLWKLVILSDKIFNLSESEICFYELQRRNRCMFTGCGQCWFFPQTVQQNWLRVLQGEPLKQFYVRRPENCIRISENLSVWVRLSIYFGYSIHLWLQTTEVSCSVHRQRHWRPNGHVQNLITLPYRPQAKSQHCPYPGQSHTLCTQWINSISCSQ